MARTIDARATSRPQSSTTAAPMQSEQAILTTWNGAPEVRAAP
jgi:hypothetical protein